MTTRVSASVLANTAVTPGTYGGSDVFSVITVDQQGRITTAANTSLKNTGVNAGNYGGGVTSSNFQLPIISVDAQGRLSAAANVTVTNTSVYANTGQLTANAAVGVVALGLPTLTSGSAGTTFGSGTQTPQIVVDAYGRVVSISATTITGGSAGIGATTYARQSTTATAAQTIFTVTGGYSVGFLQVYLNGVLLNASDLTASNGTTFTLSAAASAGDIVESFSYTVTLVNNVSPTYAGGQGGSGGQILYQSAANTTGNTVVGTTGYLLTSAGAGKPTWTNPISLDFSTANSQFFSIGVGTAASSVSGEIRAANNITAYYSSDIRFKENVQIIPNALDKVDAIGGKLFDWTDEYIEQHGGEDGYFIQKADFGVIAQDVQSVFPIATRTRPDGSLAVDYEKLCALAFAAIKELKSELEVLKGQIK
jgi:hypothetical protein